MHAVDYSGNELSFVIDWRVGFHYVIVSRIVPFHQSYQHRSSTFEPHDHVIYFIAIDEHEIQTSTFVHDVLTGYDAIFDGFFGRRIPLLYQNFFLETERESKGVAKMQPYIDVPHGIIGVDTLTGFSPLVDHTTVYCQTLGRQKPIFEKHVIS